MLTTQIIYRGAGVCLAENSYDLLVCEPALPHPVLLSRTDIIAGSGSGEHFMTSTDSEDSFEVQVRQKRLGTSQVSVNDAVAVRGPGSVVNVFSSPTTVP